MYINTIYVHDKMALYNHIYKYTFLHLILLGLLIPSHLASAIFRLLVSRFSYFSEYQTIVPEVCASLQYFQGTWIVIGFYMSVNAILFRYQVFPSIADLKSFQISTNFCQALTQSCLPFDWKLCSGLQW